MRLSHYKVSTPLPLLSGRLFTMQGDNHTLHVLARADASRPEDVLAQDGVRYYCLEAQLDGVVAVTL